MLLSDHNNTSITMHRRPRTQHHRPHRHTNNTVVSRTTMVYQPVHPPTEPQRPSSGISIDDDGYSTCTATDTSTSNSSYCSSDSSNGIDITKKQMLPLYQQYHNSHQWYDTPNFQRSGRHTTATTTTNDKCRQHQSPYKAAPSSVANSATSHTKRLQRMIYRFLFVTVVFMNLSFLVIHQRYHIGNIMMMSRSDIGDGFHSVTIDTDDSGGSSSSSSSPHINNFIRRQLYTIVDVPSTPQLQAQTPHFLLSSPAAIATVQQQQQLMSPVATTTNVAHDINKKNVEQVHTHHQSPPVQPQPQQQQEQQFPVQNQPPTKITYYSHGRHDRSGAVVHDMMWVHAYAYSQNGIYGGACGGPQYDKDHRHPNSELSGQDATLSAATATKIMTYQNVTQELIDQLHWNVALKYDCPTNFQNSTTEVLVERDFYIDLNASIFTPSWKRYFQQQIAESVSATTSTSTAQELANTITDSTIVVDDTGSLGIITTNSEMNAIIPADFDDDTSNENEVYIIAVHIRRGDVDPCTYVNRYLSNDYYLKLIKRYYKLVPRQYKNVVVNIYSESQSYESFDVFRDVYHNYNVYLDDTLHNVWNALSTANVAILSKSSFSYVPAIVNSNTVVYTSYRHLPLPSWEVVDLESSHTARREVMTIHQTKCSRSTQ